MIGLGRALPHVASQLAHSLNELESRETGLQIELNEQRGVEAELQARAAHGACRAPPPLSLGAPVHVQNDVAKLRRENEAIVQPALAAIVQVRTAGSAVGSDSLLASSPWLGPLQEIADVRSELSRTTSAAEALTRSKGELRDRVLVLQARVGWAGMGCLGRHVGPLLPSHCPSSQAQTSVSDSTSGALALELSKVRRGQRQRAKEVGAATSFLPPPSFLPPHGRSKATRRAWSEQSAQCAAPSTTRAPRRAR